MRSPPFSALPRAHVIRARQGEFPYAIPMSRKNRFFRLCHRCGDVAVRRGMGEGLLARPALRTWNASEVRRCRRGPTWLPGHWAGVCGIRSSPRSSPATSRSTRSTATPLPGRDPSRRSSEGPRSRRAGPPVARSDQDQRRRADQRDAHHACRTEAALRQGNPVRPGPTSTLPPPPCSWAFPVRRCVRPDQPPDAGDPPMGPTCACTPDGPATLLGHEFVTSY